MHHWESLLPPISLFLEYYWLVTRDVYPRYLQLGPISGSSSFLPCLWMITWSGGGLSSHDWLLLAPFLSLYLIGCYCFPLAFFPSHRVSSRHPCYVIGLSLTHLFPQLCHWRNLHVCHLASRHLLWSDPHVTLY